MHSLRVIHPVEGAEVLGVSPQVVRAVQTVAYARLGDATPYRRMSAISRILGNEHSDDNRPFEGPIMTAPRVRWEPSLETGEPGQRSIDYTLYWAYDGSDDGDGDDAGDHVSEHNMTVFALEEHCRHGAADCYFDHGVAYYIGYASEILDSPDWKLIEVDWSTD